MRDESNLGAEVVWESFCERYGGPWTDDNESVAAKQCRSVASELIRRVDAYRHELASNPDGPNPDRTTTKPGQYRAFQYRGQELGDWPTWAASNQDLRKTATGYGIVIRLEMHEIEKGYWLIQSASGQIILMADAAFNAIFEVPK